jgi:flagellar biosynthesis protein FliR
LQLVDHLSPLAVPFVLVLARISGIFVLTPVLSSASIPRRYKALLAFTLSAAVFPLAQQTGLSEAVVSDLPTMGLVIFSELLIGFVIGLIASMPLIAVQMAGFLMGYQMGLGLAQAYNPEMEGSNGVINQLLFTMGITVYVGVGGLDLILVALLETFERIPTGAFSAKDVPIDLVVELINSGIDLAIRLSAPVLGVILLSLISMGFVMKTMPQINILSVGFAAKILTGLTILSIALVSVNAVIHEETLRSLDGLIQWVQTF